MKRKPKLDSFDLLEVIRVREEAIARADSNANREWKTEVLDLLFEVCKTHEFLTIDDLRERILRAIKEDPDFPTTHNLSALGPIMRRGAKMGWMEGTEASQPSRVVTTHSRPQRVWKSKLYMRRYFGTE